MTFKAYKELNVKTTTGEDLPISIEFSYNEINQKYLEPI